MHKLKWTVAFLATSLVCLDHVSTIPCHAEDISVSGEW